MLVDMSYLVAMTALLWRGVFGALELIISHSARWNPEEWEALCDYFNHYMIIKSGHQKNEASGLLVISKQSNILDGNY